MGTYIIRPTGTDSNSNWTLDLGTAAACLASSDDNTVNVTATHATVDALLRLNFTGNSIYLDGSGSPISFAGLPSGWTPTTAVLQTDGAAHSTGIVAKGFGGGDPSTSTLFFQYDALTEAQVATVTDTSTVSFTELQGPFSYTNPNVPGQSALTLISNGCGIRAHLVGCAGGTASRFADAFVDQLFISGNYSIAATWWYNPVTNQYQFSANPGAPWIAQNPTLTVIKVTPNAGVIAGGTAVTIDGTGFGNGATVTFGGTSATSVVVLDQTKITCVTPAHASGYVTVTVTNPDTTTGSLANGYLYVEPVWWNLGDLWFLGFAPPDLGWFLGPFPWVEEPPFLTIQRWIDAGNAFPGTVPVDTKGWWANQTLFGGASEIVVTPGNPQHSRGWDKIVALATGNAAMLGGSPAASVTFHNHIIYAGDDYTLGSTNPTIRIFDGQADHLMAKMPNTTANLPPKCIISMLGVGDVIYVTTLDSGTSSADFAGRVFSFDPFSNILTPVATGFSGGELPYALAWHLGRLWVGTNKGDGTAGKVYFIRPDIDTAWTTDHNLSADSAGGVDSMLSYNGKLYVGSDNVNASFAKVLVRDTVGAYTTADTGSGGAAKVNNGYLAMKQLGNNLYVSYWNPDTPAISKIRKFDGTTWSTAYTGASGTLRPFILLFVANNTLFAVGGGDNLQGALVFTVDGAAWTDASANLSGPTTETTMPIFGLVSF